MKSILFIKKTLGGGGAEKLLIDTLHLIDYSSYDVTLLCCDPSGVYAPQIDSHVHVIYFRDIWSSFVLRNLFYYIPFLRGCIMSLNRKRARRALGTRHFDVAVSYLEGHSASMHLGLLDRAERNVTWVHVDLLSRPWPRRYYASPAEEEHFYQQVDEIVFVSKASETHFDGYIKKHAPTRVVYNLIDFDIINVRAAEFPVSISRPSIVSVGRLEPQKRFDRLLEAVAKMRERGLKPDVWILGEGKLRSALEKQVSMLQLADQVHMPGFVSNPYPYVAAADIYVCSSDAEGFPLAVAEAICLGKPVVSTIVSGSDEMLSEGRGVLVPFDENALADACEHLLQSAELRDGMGKKAREAARLRFGIRAYMDAFYSALDIQ